MVRLTVAKLYILEILTVYKAMPNTLLPLVNNFVNCEYNEITMFLSIKYVISPINASGQSVLYLFQVLYQVIFGLQNLQHFPVFHLSFVLFTKKQNNE